MGLHSHSSLLCGGNAAARAVVLIVVGGARVTTAQCFVCLGSYLTGPITSPLVASKLGGWVGGREK